MAKRYELTDAQWRRISDLVAGKAGDPGRTGADNRQFDPAEAILRSQQVQDTGATISAEPAWQSTAAGHPSDAKQTS